MGANNPEREAKYMEYFHHSAYVTVRKDLKGKHKEHCLCFSCQNFGDEETTLCGIAATVHTTAQEFNIVTPVWECPDFKEL